MAVKTEMLLLTSLGSADLGSCEVVWFAKNLSSVHQSWTGADTFVGLVTPYAPKMDFPEWQTPTKII